MAKETHTQEALLFQAALYIQSPWLITKIDLQEYDVPQKLETYLS